jgi:hypothetical protein
MLLVSLNLRFVSGVSIPSVDDAVATAQDDVAPFQPLITAAEGAVGQTDLTKAVKEGIDHFFEGMPIFMSALDAVGDLHPFIGGASLTHSLYVCVWSNWRDSCCHGIQNRLYTRAEASRQ